VLLNRQKLGYITHTTEYKSEGPDKSAAEKMSVKWLKIIGPILIKRGMYFLLIEPECFSLWQNFLASLAGLS
jgi:hypothetical protein